MTRCSDLGFLSDLESVEDAGSGGGQGDGAALFRGGDEAGGGFDGGPIGEVDGSLEDDVDVGAEEVELVGEGVGAAGWDEGEGGGVVGGVGIEVEGVFDEVGEAVAVVIECGV